MWEKEKVLAKKHFLLFQQYFVPFSKQISIFDTHLTLSQTTNFSLFEIGSLQMAISNLMKMTENF